MDLKDYSEATQKFFIEFMLSSDEAYARCQNILQPAYFDSKFKPVIKYMQEHAQSYNTVPSIKQVGSQTGHDFEQLDNIRDQDVNWFLDSIEQFCRHKALENAIFAAPDKLEKKNYGDVEREIKQAVLISLQKELGTDYFADPYSRLETLRDRNGMVSTGWKTIDDKLYGGFNRGELNIFAGSSGTGKSLFLQNVTINWAKQNLNCVYITLELSENLVALRFDSMVTETPTKQIFKNMDDVDLKVKMTGKKWGNIMIKYMPAGSSTNDIRAYLKEFEIQRGIKPDAIIVDYLDLIHPNNARVNPGDLFIKDKFVSEELRSLAQEMNLLLCTASQLNRDAIQEQEHDHSHIAGGLSKINTADNVMTIFTSAPMRERGEYRIQFIKTRSSAGVGTKLDLAFDSNTMRITDLETGSSTEGGKKDQSSLAAEIKAKAKSRNGQPPKSQGAQSGDDEGEQNAPTGDPKGKVQGEKLRDLLSKIQDR
jgi:archaellum biogenesis ATPase FlaH